MTKLIKGNKIGEYELVRKLGEGGNGLVWEVMAITPTAIKILNRKNSEQRFQRFADEVYAMEKCQKIKGVMPLYDRGIPKVYIPGNQAFFAMSIAESLQEIKRSLSIRESVEACRSIASTLVEMHEIDVTHRDIKPENLFRLNNEWLIGDFGLADFDKKISNSTEGERIGPILYSAPEMFNDSKQSDGKCADIFSLAKVLWVLIADQNYPVPGPIDYSIEALRVSSYTTDDSVMSLEKLLATATSFKPDLRPTALQFENELKNWLKPKTLLTPSANKPFNLSRYSNDPSLLKPRMAQDTIALLEDDKATFDRLCHGVFIKLQDCIQTIYSEIYKLTNLPAPNPTPQLNSPSPLPYIAMGSDYDYSDAYTWQYVVSMKLRSKKNGMLYTFWAGFFILQKSTTSDAGGVFPVLNAESILGAGCMYINNETVDGNDRFNNLWHTERDMLLGGSSELTVVQDILNDFSQNFSISFDTFFNFITRK